MKQPDAKRIDAKLIPTLLTAIALAAPSAAIAQGRRATRDASQEVLDQLQQEGYEADRRIDEHFSREARGCIDDGDTAQFQPEVDRLAGRTERFAEPYLPDTDSLLDDLAGQPTDVKIRLLRARNQAARNVHRCLREARSPHFRQCEAMGAWNPAECSEMLQAGIKRSDLARQGRSRIKRGRN